MDRHRHDNEKDFGIGRPVLVYPDPDGQHVGEVTVLVDGPFWVTREFNGSYQLGTFARELLGKWVNGIRLKPYKGQMLENPFKDEENPQNTGNWRQPIRWNWAPSASKDI